MPVRNANFYAMQSTRRYPLDDNATGTTDAGLQIEDDIIVDCRLSWPASLGRYAFLTALTVSPRIVTAVFAAASSPDATSGFRLIASVTIPKPLADWQTYLMDPQWPGVRGAIVFGDTDENFNGRFGTPRQGLLSPNCSYPFRDYPIPTLRKRNVGIGLQNIVGLTASGDLELVHQPMTIDGCVRNALVLRLKDNIGNRNLLQDYIGNCNNRPESRNCLNGQGIETFAGVAPDCNGNINIQFQGIDGQPFADCSDPNAGLALTTNLRLQDLCDSRDPDPFAGVDKCESSASIPGSESGGSGSQGSDSSLSPQPSESGSAGPCPGLPYTDDFDDAQAEFFHVKIGQFLFKPYDSPDEPMDSVSIESAASGGPIGIVAYTAVDQSQRNVSLFETVCGLDSSWGKKATTAVRLDNVGPMANGGIVINYHLVDPITNPHDEYFFACINRTENEVQLYRFNGGSLIKLNGVTPASPLVYGDWYKIVVQVSQFSLTQTAIAVTVTGDTNPSWPTVNFSSLTNRFGLDDGNYGLGTNRSKALFSYFQLEEF